MTKSSYRHDSRPRAKRLFGSWFLFYTIMASAVIAGCADDSTGADKQTADVAPVKSSADDALDLSAEKLPPNIRQNHLAKGVVTSTVLTVNNDAKYANATHLPYANPDAPKGGVLSMSAIGMFNSLNSFIDQGVPATGTFYLYDTLMAGSLDESYVLYPQLANAVTHNPDDGSWIIYHIHPDARFWDGSAVTADDVKATFEAILTKGLMSWRGFLGGIDAIEVLDSHRVKFYFNQMASADLGASVGLMPVFAKSDIEKRFDQVSLVPLMGSGAYQLELAEPSRRVRYVRDPNYWGRELMVNRGRFNFDTIEYQYFADDAVAFEAFKTGQYRFRIETDIKRWATFDNTARSSAIQKASIINQNPVLMQGLVMNLRRPLFRDKRVRQAMNLAFDFEWTNRQLLYGEYQRLDSYFFGSALQAKGAPSSDELAVLQALPLNQDEQSAIKGVPNQPVSNGDGINRTNLLKARALLLDAGLSYHNGKLHDKDGQVVRLEILAQDDKYQAVLLPYIAHLKRLGIDARLRRMDSSSYLHAKRAYDFDMIIDSFMQGNSPGAEQGYLWGSKSADEAGNQNTIGIKSAAIDSVIDKLSKATSRDETILYAKVLDRLLLAGEYMIPWYGKNTTDVMYYQGYQHPSTPPSSSIGLDYWWYQPPKDTTQD